MIAALLISAAGFLIAPPSVSAKIEWERLADIILDDMPIDVAVSANGELAYILCTGKILRYSIEENDITDTIPIKRNYTQLSISPDGDTLFLTGDKKRRVSMINVAQVFDMGIGNSPVIGNTQAPNTLYCFFDFQ